MKPPFYLEAPKGDEYKPTFGERLQRAWDVTPPEAFFSLAEALARPQGTFSQNLALGLSGFGRELTASKKRRGLASAFDSMAADIPATQRPIFEQMVQNNPEALMGMAAERMFAKPAEQWKGIDVDGDGRNDFQQSSLTGEFKDIPKTLAEEERVRRAGASSVTVNNLPAELGARTAMGEGFTANYDDIKRRIEKFYDGPLGQQAVRRGQMIFNTGEGGKLWADVETGKEALVRTLTGAGMAQAEAENQASRYALSPYDTKFDALQKVERLRRDLNNVARGAYGARGRTYTPPPAGSNVGQSPSIPDWAR